jgi:hypothetical protein
MNAILITLLVTFGFLMLLSVTYKPKIKKNVQNIRVPKKLVSKKVVMGPENPLWMKMYAEEMAKQKTALTANVLKKWIADDIKIELRPDILIR